ncbi:MAG: elongation factor P [Candidatus Nealsonbacteria bacterium]
MLSSGDLRKGVRILIDGEPYEVLDSNPMKKAQRRVVMQTKLKSLLTGNALERNFHQGENFEEAELSKLQSKFLYTHRGLYIFCEEKNSSKRFELNEELLGTRAKFLKPDELVDAIIFNEKVISVSLPIKLSLKVTEAPPGVKGDSAQGGTKIVTLETGAQVSVPLFVEEGDIIEVNTETGEYTRRIE